MFRRNKKLADPLVRPVFVELTDARSGVSHAISETVYADCLAARAGTFTVACEARVLPAPMTAGPGAPCPECHTQMRVVWHSQ